jgi:hypothetical protein
MGKKSKKHKKKHKKMSTKKKILIGAGIAVVAVAACAGAYYIAKRHKKHQQGRLLGATGGTRDIGSLNSGGSVHPSLLPYLGLQENKQYLYNNEPIPLPVAVTVGLGWDSEGANVNLDILGSVFNSSGQSVGYVQGSTIQTLFGGAISHSGDDTAGSNTLSSVLGDNEHITIDFGMLPPEAATIVIGVLLVNGTGLRNCYINVLPLLKPDSISNTATTVEYESDSDDDSSNFKNQNIGYSGPQDDDGDDELILLYKAKLDQQHPNFPQSRGFIPLKFARNFQNGSWQLVPIRQVTTIDNQYGLWPALERAASQAGPQSGYPQQPQQYSQPQYSQPQPYSPPQYQQGGYGGYPQQGQGFPPSQPNIFGDQSFGGYPQQYSQPPYNPNYPPQY